MEQGLFCSRAYKNSENTKDHKKTSGFHTAQREKESQKGWHFVKGKKFQKHQPIILSRQGMNTKNLTDWNASDLICGEEMQETSHKEG